MGIMERRMRQKEAIKSSILEAALKIVRQEGWPALSMRKIADYIEYSAPVIYEYFDSKDALLIQLTRLGFLKLAQAMQKAVVNVSEPGDRLMKMWLSYWEFAFAYKEFYQLMFGIGTTCGANPFDVMEAGKIEEIVIPAIIETLPNIQRTDVIAASKYYAYWSAVHGLIALSFLNQGGSEEFNRHVLFDVINGITMAESQ